MKKINHLTDLRILILLFVSSASFCLETVPYVDLSKYLGTWYEIASYPMFFQRGCTATQATYTQREDGLISVLNKCRKNNLNGPWKQAEGVAKVVDLQSNSKLKVKFFLFWGDYWIIDLGQDYDYAVVSEPRKKYLWILSRSPQMKEDLFKDIMNKLEQKGFDLKRLQLTPQPEPGSSH